MPFNYLSQSIIATLSIEKKNNDVFYNPELQPSYNGYAADGFLYSNGQVTPASASWATEPFGSYRGSSAAFPNSVLLLLSNTSLAVLDETSHNLNLWLLALLSDSYALSNNFALGSIAHSYSQTLQGFQPRGLTYANGVISVIYNPDPGSIAINGTLVVNLDLAQDRVYLETVVPV
jgi:hypothetical protein